MKENLFDNRNPIQESANYQGNETLLFQERLQNPEIKKQLIDTLYELYSTRESLPSDTEKWIGTKEQIAEDLEEDIRAVFSSTDISYSKGMGSGSGGNQTGNVEFSSLNPETGEKWTQKQLSIIEAHEKGHVVRSFQYPGKSFEAKMQSGFDFSKVVTDEIEEFIEKQKNENVALEEAKRSLVEYFKSPMEIVERMAQLKNYFGMKGAEKLTKEHLSYAKKHYIPDTGSPILQMQPFFSAITPETEIRFLELVNSLGI